MSLQTPLQLAFPAGQLVQVRFAHDIPAPHALAHRPQLCESVAGSTHAPLHWIRPDGQGGSAQMPFAHTFPAAQTLAHPPQLRGSLAGSEQTPLHSA
jgi:hypothetical protein